MSSAPETIPAETRTRETRVFAFLTVVLAPLLAVTLIGAYGLFIWVFQMFMGPPRG
jgi:nitrate reductase NapE